MIKPALAGSRGVTMIELVVALAIIGIAFSAMLPEVGSWMRGLAVRNAGESIRAGIERARMESLRRNSSVSFWLVSDTEKSLTNSCVSSNAGPSWVVSGTSPEGKCAADPSTSDDPLLVERWSAADGSNGVSIAGLDSTGGAANSVTFNSLGQLMAGSQLMRVDVTHSITGTRSLRVQVDSGGTVRMCDPNVDANDPRKC